MTQAVLQKLLAIPCIHSLTLWRQYPKITMSIMPTIFLKMYFCGECGQCHPKDCVLSSYSQALVPVLCNNYLTEHVVTFGTKSFQINVTYHTMCTLLHPMQIILHPLDGRLLYFLDIIKFAAMYTQKSPCAWLIPSQSSACLHPCIVQLLPPTCLCALIENVHYNVCLQWTLFCL